jgi:excisionase family DNA binding protein
MSSPAGTPPRQALLPQRCAVPRAPATNPTRDTHPPRPAPAAQQQTKPFAQLIDAKVAGRLLGVPDTWVSAQARANRIPHYRLGHYVRFDPDDLAGWLTERKTTPCKDR